jgi:hypothetical protein
MPPKPLNNNSLTETCNQCAVYGHMNNSESLQTLESTDEVSYSSSSILLNPNGLMSFQQEQDNYDCFANEIKAAIQSGNENMSSVLRSLKHLNQWKISEIDSACVVWLQVCKLTFHCSIIHNRGSIFTLINHNLYYTPRHRREAAVLLSFSQTHVVPKART